jgi:hypothetical protein
MSAIKNISLYIPHVFENFSKAYILEKMSNFGEVCKIDFVYKMGKNGKTYNAAYIHFENWFDTATAANFQEQVLNPEKEARILYDDPWFWIVLENKTTKHKHVPGNRKPRIVLESFVSHQVVSDSFKTPEKLIPIKLYDLFSQHSTNQSVSNKITQKEMNEEYEDIERLMEEDDKHLVSIDIRYVKELENENQNLLSNLEDFLHVFEKNKTNVEYYKDLYFNELKNREKYISKPNLINY